jgi:Kiwa KwaB-like protein
VGTPSTGWGLPTASTGKSRDSVEALFSRLLAAKPTGSATLFFGGEAGDGGAAPYRKVTISEDLGGEFVNLAGRSLAQFRRDDGSPLTFLEYDPSYDPLEDEIQYIDLSKDAFMKGAIGAIPPAETAPSWTDADPLVGHPKSFVVALPLEVLGVVQFIRSLSAQKEFTPDKGILARLVANNRFESLSDARTIVFEPSFQVIRAGGYAFVLDRTAFERLFNYYGQLETHATAVLQGVRKYVGADEFAKLKDSTLASPRAVKTLRSTPVGFDLDKYSTRRLNRVLRDWKVSIRVTVEDGKRRLSIDPKRPMDMVRLLTDSYLQSPMTNYRYVVTSKRKVGSSV